MMLPKTHRAPCTVHRALLSNKNTLASCYHRPHTPKFPALLCACTCTGLSFIGVAVGMVAAIIYTVFDNRWGQRWSGWVGVAVVCFACGSCQRAVGGWNQDIALAAEQPDLFCLSC